jgi:hypothetical protein
MPTRQQKRARARMPSRQKRRGSVAFLSVIVIILLAGTGLLVLFKSNPKPLTRGAIPGEHWHANLKIELCGKTLGDYPFIEGEIHSHGDGVIHIHPQTPAFSGDNANLGAFLRTYETTLRTDENGKQQLVLPDGKSYADGDTCPGSKTKHTIETLVNGKRAEGDPSLLLPKDGDAFIIRFGPKATGTMPNPLAPEGAQVVPEG